jgi:curved DNA-binding protein CbpA
MVLGLPYSADLTDRDVRAAFPARMRAVHPDRDGDPEAAAAVGAVYDALRSGVRRGSCWPPR